jgi:hypothetical protein
LVLKLHTAYGTRPRNVTRHMPTGRALLWDRR